MCGVVCVILCLAIVVQCRLVTDRQTDITVVNLHVICLCVMCETLQCFWCAEVTLLVAYIISEIMP